MKIKFLTILISCVVLTAVLISCVTIPLTSGNETESSKPNGTDISAISNENSPGTESSDESTNESTDNSTDTSSKDDVKPVMSQSLDWSSRTAKECDEYFKNSVIVGDSIMLGFKTYVGQKRSTNDDFMSTLKFHAGGSYGVHNALLPVSSKSVHPLFEGVQTPIEDAVQKMGVEKVFILFGLNDVGLYSDGKGPQKTFENYKILFSKIKEKSPNVEIIIISATYLYEEWDKQMVKLTSNHLRQLNQLMLEYCTANGMDYIDVATALADSKGYLQPKYCSDNECHLTYEAYDVWMDIFRAYAASKLDGNYSNVASMTAAFS